MVIKLFCFLITYHSLFLYTTCNLHAIYLMYVAHFSGKNVSDVRNNGPDRLTWTVLTVLILLVIVNAVFYYKLWVLEKWTQRSDQKFSWIDLQDIR